MNQLWQRKQSIYNLGYRIKLLSQTLNRRLQAILDPFGLTPFQWEVLDCLWQEDGVPTSTLTKQLQQLGGTLTGVLDVMEKRGLIYRERDQNDRRVCRIWLTEAGEQLREVVPPVVKTLKKETFECLSAQELQLFSDLVDRIIDHTSEE
ncbi:MarR family transcriptional regulator [Phormidium tenue FACHB-886]|nr:MarR family transcriptional regulator [Phormidium tenue FACHB-886]